MFKIIRMYKYVDISKISKLDVGEDTINEVNEFIDDYYERYTGLFLQSKQFISKLVE